MERTHERAPEAWEPDVWVRDDEAPAAPRVRPRPRRRDLPDDVVTELARAGTGRSNVLARDLAAGASAFESGRFQEAYRYLRPLAERAPTVAPVRELYGLTLYRLGRWRVAAAELEAFRELTGSLEHEPVVADCERALGHHTAVERRWQELRQASPSAEILGEARIVMAGDLADRGELDAAIGVLARYEADRARPRPWMVRTWYALADLYERAGDVPRARALFQRLVRMDAEWFDAAERLAALQ
ncbi:MAG TPA: tetratricopeptide repeat protein [Acidimicrobiales bacterium]|nr:tetratricopeptide repeat protein [Acidimicrobiales bacterium]